MTAIPVLTARQAAEWDERARAAAQIPSRVLMETAGRAVAAVLVRAYRNELRGGVLLVAGQGNNGGDGWVAARALRALGVGVAAVETGKGRSPDCEANRQLAVAEGVTVVEQGEWPQAAVAIDALLGTGASGAPRGETAQLAARLAGYRVPVVAVDGPTGLDLSTGEAHGPVRADLTVTFGGVRRGHVLARDWCGTVVVTDIGFPPADSAWPVLVTDRSAAAVLPRFDPAMHKGERGRVVVIGGDQGMAGAALHAASAALAAGAGLVKLVAHDATVRAAQAHLPDVLSSVSALGPDVESAVLQDLEWADAVVLGPGLGRGDARTRFVRTILERAGVPVIVDADALHSGRDALSAGNADRVFTPHPGEFAAMFPELASDVARDRFAAAEHAHEALTSARTPSPQAALLLKGVPTVIAAGAPVRVVAAGNPALATGGSGDLLAGFIGSFLARGVAPAEAAALGAQVLGRAAELASGEFTVRSTRPADVLAALPELWLAWATDAPVEPPVLARLPAVAVV